MSLSPESAALLIQSLPAAHPAPAAIGESWARCEAQGLSRDGPLRFPAVGPTQLAARRERNALLLAAAEPHLRWALAHLPGGTSVACITDRDGIVLLAAGDPGQLRRFGLQPGHDWSERAMGTNGAGTCLATGRPVAIAGPEHYMTALHDCTCTAAPVRDGSGAVMGAVGLGSSVADAQPGGIDFATRLADLIAADLQESALAQRGPQAESDAALSAKVSQRIEAARAALRADMQAQGLLDRDGWRVSEELHSSMTGTEWVLRPIHSRHESPDLRAVVKIDFGGHTE
jgi:transcriptional regulator of acetoin/glycerol metabolism